MLQETQFSCMSLSRPFFISCLSFHPISVSLGFSLTTRLICKHPCALFILSFPLWCWCSWLCECGLRNMSPQFMLTITVRLPRIPPVRKRETQQAWFNEQWRLPWSKHTHTAMFTHVHAPSAGAVLRPLGKEQHTIHDMTFKPKCLSWSR